METFTFTCTRNPSKPTSHDDRGRKDDRGQQGPTGKERFRVKGFVTRQLEFVAFQGWVGVGVSTSGLAIRGLEAEVRDVEPNVIRLPLFTAPV